MTEAGKVSVSEASLSSLVLSHLCGSCSQLFYVQVTISFLTEFQYFLMEMASAIPGESVILTECWED